MPALRRYLVAGLLVWVPLGVTVLVIKFLIDLMDRTLLLLPQAYRPESLLGFRIPGLGIVLTAIIVLGTGIVVVNLFGHKLISIWERLLARIPLVRSIYSGVKQVVETMLSSDGKSFSKVVLIEYPRRELWTLALVSGEGWRTAGDRIGEDMVSVFVPTTPNPTSGFFLMVPRKDTIELDISVDDGLKMIISAGVLLPEKRDPARPAGGKSVS